MVSGEEIYKKDSLLYLKDVCIDYTPESIVALTSLIP